MRYTRNKNKIQEKKRNKTIKKMNCSPAAKMKRAGPDTCYSKDILQKIKNAYNDSHPSEKIKSNNPSAVWTELKDRMSNCPTEDCWLK